MIREIVKFFVTVLICIMVFLTSVISQSSSVDTINIDKVDSIRICLQKDSLSSSLLFLEIDYLNKEAYGCIIYNANNNLKGYRIVISQDSVNRIELSQRILKKYSNSLKAFFVSPSDFLTGFPGITKNKHLMSHDTKRYLFLEIGKKTIFDKWFMRSSSVEANDKRIFKILLSLVSLSH